MQSEQSLHRASSNSIRSQWEPWLEAGLVGAFVAAQANGWLRFFERPTSLMSAIFGLIVGWALADFVSGLVHYCADNFGSPATPLVGHSIIRTFREHHNAPRAMLSHGFLERNGWNCGGAALLSMLNHGLSPLQGAFTSSVLLSGALFLAATNQIHAWAHAKDVPLLVARLQHWGLLLSPELHARHHRPFEERADEQPSAPFGNQSSSFLAGHYCITSGLCDRVSSRIRSA